MTVWIYPVEILPISNAGEDSTYSVTQCGEQNIIIIADGLNSTSNIPGVCDTGTCSEDVKYCTTPDAITSETCLSFDDCDEIKVCVGGGNENADCSSYGVCANCSGGLSNTCESNETNLDCSLQSGCKWIMDTCISSSIIVTEKDCCESNNGIWDDDNDICMLHYTYIFYFIESKAQPALYSHELRKPRFVLYLPF